MPTGDEQPGPTPAAALPAAPGGGGKGRLLAWVAAIACTALAIGVIVHMFTDRPQDDMSRPTLWRCQNDAVCGKSFVLTIAEFRRMIEEGPPGGEVPKLTTAEVYAQAVCGLQPDEPLWCPHCGSYNLARGYPCPHCEGVVALGPHGSMPDICPHCGRNPAVEPASEPDDDG